MQRWIALTAFTLLLSATATLQAQLPDQVFGVRGAPERGTVTNVTPDEVTIGSAKVAVNQIRKVTFGGDPAELRTARDRALQGQIEDALADLKKIDVAGLNRELIKQDVEYYIAYCTSKLALAGGGDKNEAIRLLLEFLKAAPRSHHAYAANELVGDLALATKRYDNAEKFYNELAKAPWPDFKMRAVVLVANTLVAQGKYPDAQKQFEQVIGASIDTPAANRQKLFAQLGKAVCQAEQGSPSEGVAAVEQIIAKNDPQDAELFGRAYNAMGRCHVKAGRDKDALLAFLHTDVLFFQNPDAHAEALFNLGELWAKADKSDRAVAARNLLQQRYAGTRWASQN
ncbi:MAG: tetratricopeptide repeat protein [Pirellulaceae bacterium]|jgi:tetratricopeptide (TPR) repeat protein|nr:tetratricopeptide repeat protein [Pirellulaceae bacterium]